MNTTFLLLAEFGSADIPVEIVCSRYLGLDARTAKRQAAMAVLPFPAFRPGTQKGPWLARITDVAAWLDKERERGVSDWRNRQGAHSNLDS